MQKLWRRDYNFNVNKDICYEIVIFYHLLKSTTHCVVGHCCLTHQALSDDQHVLHLNAPHLGEGLWSSLSAWCVRQQWPPTQDHWLDIFSWWVRAVLRWRRPTRPQLNTTSMTWPSPSHRQITHVVFRYYINPYRYQSKQLSRLFTLCMLYIYVCLLLINYIHYHHSLKVLPCSKLSFIISCLVIVNKYILIYKLCL